VPGFESSQWYGLLAPARTPGAILDRLHGDFAAALSHGPLRERLLAQGFEVVGNSRSAFAGYIVEEIGKWARVIREAKIRAD